MHSFVLGKTEEYELDGENLKIPDGKTYSPGGIRKDWLPRHRKFIEKLESEGYKLRFSGCSAVDAHQILHKGGIFCYPALKEKPEGKLRLLFEAVPMGYIIQQAGGRISDGSSDILEKLPDRVDIRVPLYIGGTDEIEHLESMA